MKLNQFVQASLFVAVSAMLAPTMANATVTTSLTIKENEASKTTGTGDGKAPFAFIVNQTGWLKFEPQQESSSKDTLLFAGKYQSGGPVAKGTVYAWLVDPKAPNAVSDKLTLTYETSDKGITEITDGSFKSDSGGANLGALPVGLGVLEKSTPVSISTFYKLSGGNYVATSLPGNLSISVQSSVAAVPEPEEWAMMLVGAGLVSFQVRRKQAKVAA